MTPACALLALLSALANLTFARPRRKPGTASAQTASPHHTFDTGPEAGALCGFEPGNPSAAQSLPGANGRCHAEVSSQSPEVDELSQQDNHSKDNSFPKVIDSDMDNDADSQSDGVNSSSCESLNIVLTLYKIYQKKSHFPNQDRIKQS
ncbi:hypothetical protein QZH41_001376 [Actinostola sp. cb2023]|nr:hypothetical protein QZH41_001376 [Actinostola sp. cb2023]